MSEKNTHSILESIKKKLHKFDQKPEGDMADVASEFDYVAPVKKEEPYAPINQVAAPAPAQNQAPQPAQPPVTETPPVVQTPAAEQAPKVEAKKENSGLEDIDWDDEASVKPVVAQVAANAQSAEPNVESYEEFDENDLEDFEDEVDFEEEIAEEVAVVAPMPSLPAKEDDELNFDELEQEELKETAEKKEEVAVKKEEDDDLNLDDLDFDEIKQEKPPVAAEKPAEHDPHDEELDELEREIQRQKEEAAEAQKEVHIELEEELLGMKAAAPEVVAPVVPVIEVVTPPAPLVEEIAKEIPPLPKVEKIEDEDFPEFPELPPVQTQTAIEMSSKSNSQITQQNTQPKGILLDENTVKQTSDSVKKLLDAKNIVSGITSFSQSPMLSELAMQMLEPKLEKWLNANLSQLVEKIVREEIKKIIPRE